MEKLSGIRACVFDAYGTLFDVHAAVARHAQEIGPQAERLSELWRVKQLEYCWVRSLAGAYRDFAELTRDALFYAAARCSRSAMARHSGPSGNASTMISSAPASSQRCNSA